MKALFKEMRNNIVAGVLVLLPLITTIYVFFKLFGLVDKALPSLFHAIVPQIPPNWGFGMGTLIVLLLAYFTGAGAKNAIGRFFIGTGNTIISNIPIVNKIYNGLQQILDAVVSSKKKLFERAVLIEYPKADCYSIGFVTSTTSGEIPVKLQQTMLSVFVPTTPNPTSGFLLFLPETNVTYLDMSVETAIKLVMSAGMVNSDQIKRTQHMFAIDPKTKNWNWWKNLRRSKSDKRLHDPRD